MCRAKVTALQTVSTKFVPVTDCSIYATVLVLMPM